MQDLFPKNSSYPSSLPMCVQGFVCPREQGCFTDFPVSRAADPKVPEVSSEQLPRCAVE